MNIQDMKPSMIHLSVPPLTGTFGKSEKENAAALMIWILANNGDTWRPVESKEIESITVHPEEKGWLRDMLSNPFIKFGFSDLAQDGYITREKAFTEKGLEALFRSKWIRGLDRFDRLAWCCSACLETRPAAKDQQKGQTAICDCGGMTVLMTLREAMTVWDTPR